MKDLLDDILFILSDLRIEDILTIAFMSIVEIAIIVIVVMALI